MATETMNDKIMNLRSKTGAGIMDCKKALVESNGDLEKAVESLRKKGLADLAKRSGRTTKEGIISIKVSPDGKAIAMAELNCETDFVAKTPEFKTLAEDFSSYVMDHPSVADYAADAGVKEMVQKVALKVGENMSMRRGFCMQAGSGCTVSYYLHNDNKKAALVEVGYEGISEEAAKDIAKELALQSVAMFPQWLRREDIPAAVIEKEKEIYTINAKNQGKPEAAIVKMLEGRLRKFGEETCLLLQASIRDSKTSVTDYINKAAADKGGKITVKRFVRFQVGE